LTTTVSTRTRKTLETLLVRSMPNYTGCSDIVFATTQKEMSLSK
jgi:hypothetical protein